MSEKRFKKMDTIIDPFPIWDTVEEKGYNCTDTLDVLVDLLNEQQDTIFKLQDLCGKSDSENAKLRIENKMLEKEVNLLRPTNLEQFEQIQKLQEENRELRQSVEYWQKKYEEGTETFQIN